MAPLASFPVSSGQFEIVLRAYILQQVTFESCWVLQPAA